MDRPTRNREPRSLGPLELRLTHAQGVERFDPNGQVTGLLVGAERYAAMKPVAGLRSVLSGGPAVLYETEDVAIPLTMVEYVALVGREMSPDQVRALRERFGGDPFDLQSDFYDEVTCEAVQPKGVLADFLEANGLADVLPSGPS